MEYPLYLAWALVAAHPFVAVLLFACACGLVCFGVAIWRSV